MKSIMVAVVAALALVVVACGDDDKSSGGGGGTSAAKPAATDVTKCGTEKGKKATGTPIKLGAIATKQPGTDFTDIPNAAKAFFDCVNDNGGIKGHPIQYAIETEQTDPGQNASLARKLVESEKVVGIVGGLSLIECAVNHKYYEQKGFYVINAGIAPECYGTPNSAAVNMGPRYSSDGAVQYVIRQGVKKIVFDQSNVPGTGYIAEGPALVAKDAGIPIVQLKENVPIQDANSIALKQVQSAGPDGAVVLNFTPPEALKILQAAQRQGLQNRVKAWGCSTPCNTDFLAKALGSQWDNKLGVNAELNLTNAPGPHSARQELQDRHPLQALVLRRRAPAHPQQHRLDQHPEERQDGDQGAVLRNLRGRSGDRPGRRRGPRSPPRGPRPPRTGSRRRAG
jgi:branched-chain amino acid transport system substrate-binding protein